MLAVSAPLKDEPRKKLGASVSKTTVHVISHTHWDREWYFTDDDSQVFMCMAFEEMLDKLESVDAIKCYMLDAQTSVLEEYLRLKPQYSDRVHALVSSGKLITGPWYSQPDVFSVQGESLIRNLLIGMKQARELGRCMMIGYLPDTFGFNAQMPSIYHSVGIDRAVVRRGYDPKYVPSTEFNWVALDGETRVLCAVQPFGYSMAHPKRGGRMRNFDRNQLFKETYPLLEKVEELSDADNVMLTVGGDQVTIDDRIDEFVDQMQRNDPNPDNVYVQSNLEDYFEAMAAEGRDHPDYQGELRMPRFARVHRTISSVRYDIKQANYEAEMALLRKAEPMAAIAKRLGIYFDDANIERAWKLILESQAHDSMGCCNSDATNATVLKRCKDSFNTSDGVFYLLARLVGQNISHEGHESHFILVNGGLTDHAAYTRHTIVSSTPAVKITDTDGNPVDYVVLSQKPKPFERKVEINVNGESETKEDRYFYESEILLANAPVPPMGFATFYVDPVEDVELPAFAAQGGAAIENEALKLSVVEGKVVLEDKKTGTAIQDAIVFEDCANDGDLYDFSPLEEDDTIPFRIERVVGHASCGGIQKLTLAGEIDLPERLNDERTARVGKAVVPVEVMFTLGRDDRLDIDVKVDNTVCDHRMRMLIKTGIDATTVRAGAPFGAIVREKGGFEPNWHDTYGECPVDINPMEGFVSIADDSRAALVMAEGNKEYEIVGPGTVAVTLFETCGYLGKCDLKFRPGRESGRPAATPQSQMQGELSFHLALAMGPAENHVEREAAQVEAFRTVVTLYQDQPFNKSFQRMDYFDVHVPQVDVPSSMSLVGSVPAGLAFGSVVAPGDTDGLLLRVFNLTDDPIDCAPGMLAGRDAAATDATGAEVPYDGTVLPNAMLTVRC